MSKRITTRWFVSAWIVAVLAGIGTAVLARFSQGSSPLIVLAIADLVVVVAVLVMFIAWLGALINLGRQRSWGWFAFILLVYVLSVGTLGVIPMVAYAIAGPDDMGEVAIRPTTT
jgi:uncharacterized membrane protein